MSDGYNNQNSKAIAHLTRVDCFGYFIIFLCFLFGSQAFMLQNNMKETLDSFMNMFYAIILIPYPWWIYLVVGGISLLFTIIA